MVICLEWGADLHMFQLMPLPLSLASVKSRLVLPFWYRLTWVVPDKGPLNGCVVCVYTDRKSCLSSRLVPSAHMHMCMISRVSSRVVSTSDCGVNGITPSTVVFVATAAAIYSLEHGLCTFTAPLGSTQPSTLCGMVEWVSAYGLSNNNNGDGGCGW